MEKPTSQEHVVFLQDAIIDMALKFVLGMFNEHQPPGLLAHNFALVRKLDDTILKIAEYEHDGIFELETIRLASIFYPTGFLHSNRSQIIEKSRQTARQFLFQKKYPNSFINKVEDLIISLQSKPQTKDARLLSDAYSFCFWGDDYKEMQQFLRAEKEIIEKNTFSDSEWWHQQLQKALDIHYYLDYSKKVFEPTLGRNILYIKKQISQLEKKPLEKTGRFQIEQGSTIRSVQTFFRSAFRVHINLSAIADNKANIMISVNAIILSVMVTVLSYRNLPETNPGIMAPLIILLLSGLASLTFAILSSRPRVTKLNDGQTDMSHIKKNMTFFGNFSVLELEKFEDLMDEMLKNNELLFSNMVRDLYHLGKVLDVKYRYLAISYNIFMIGFILSIILFFVVYFI